MSKATVRKARTKPSTAVAVRPPRASLGIAIIARNAQKTIGACLDSIVPFVEQVVVCVDETTTDHTGKHARKHGAQVVTGLKVSEWHECEHHGRVRAQHFANAREESFKYLRKDLDWWGWIDADDIVRGGEHLPEFLSKLTPDVGGVWLSYHYSRAGDNGPTSTLFDRERIVRSSMPWKWQHRVHEILTPADKPTEHINWVRTDDISVVHQHVGHDTQGSAKRNILLLEIDLEENPEDMRALFYLGNQYFALGQWDAALYYYGRSTACGNTYQVWQTYLYMSMAAEKMGNLDQALACAYQAMETAPYHPEPYYRLAAVAMIKGDVQRCEFWTKLGDQRAEAPFFAFKNPLDRTFNSRITLAQAYGNAGMISRAKQQLQQAVSVVSTPDLVQGIQQYEKAEQQTEMAEAWLRVLSTLSDEKQLRMYMPADVWKFGRVRDIVVPHILAERPNTQPRIVFFCGRSVEPWAPPSIDTTGIGGSETAVVQIARRFAADGWRVDVFNEPDYLEGEYEGVGYWALSRFNDSEKAAVFVGWRNADVYGLPIERRVSLLWCHDLNRGPAGGEGCKAWDKVLGVSQWHAGYLSQVYNLANTGYVPNGIDLGRFAEPTKKVPFRCVYASSQDRGLLDLLQLWHLIVAAEPTAELHVAYGWESFDKYIQMGAPGLAEMKAAILPLLEQKGVVWRGRLPQNELAKLYQESYCWLYPTSFLEVSCISAMEAMAAGCVPVTSAAGALPETVGDAGLVIGGNTYTQAWRDFWVLCARTALLTPDTRLPLAEKGKERTQGFSWDASYQGHWKPLVAGLLEGGEKE